MVTGPEMAVAWVVLELCPGPVSQGILWQKPISALTRLVCAFRSRRCVATSRAEDSRAPAFTSDDCFIAVKSVYVSRYVRFPFQVLDPRFPDFLMTWV